MASAGRRTSALALFLGATLAMTLGVADATPATPTPPWSPMQPLSTSTDHSSDPVSIDVSADGSRAIAVWARTSGATDTVMSASATLIDGIATWGGNTELATVAAPSRAFVALSADGSRATVVWHAQGGSGSTIKSRSATISADRTQTWGPEATVRASSSMAYPTDLALSDNGGVAVVGWYEFFTPNFVAQASVGEIGGGGSTTQTWSAPTSLISGSGTVSTWGPTIGISAFGDRATAVWHASDSAHANWGAIQSATSHISGGSAAWDTVETVVESSTSSPSQEHAAVSEDGLRTSAIWTQAEGGRRVVYTSSRAAGHDPLWGTPVRLSEPAQSASSPRIASSENGTRVLGTWTLGDPPNQRVQAASATLSGTTQTWGTTTTLSGSAPRATDPMPALSSDGNLATVIWSFGEAFDQVVQASNAYTSGGAFVWSTPKSLSSSGGGVSTPQLALSSDGLVAATLWNFEVGHDAYLDTYGHDSTIAVTANGDCTQSWDGSTRCLPVAPTGINATGGNGSGSVSWTAPADPHSYGVTGYQYQLLNGSASVVLRDWTSTGSTSTSVSVGGLTNGSNYVVNVRALNNFGTGAAGLSNAFTPRTPSPGAPASAEPTPQPSVSSSPASPQPTNQPMPTELRPGVGSLVVNGVATPVTITPSSNGSTLVVSGAGVQIVLAATGPNGRPLPLAPDGSLIVSQAGQLPISASGFAADSQVTLYLFSDPIVLGTVRTGASGAVSADAVIPAGVATGSHTIQIVGSLPSGAPMALSVGVTVKAPAAARGARPTIAIAGPRVKDASSRFTVKATGVQAQCAVSFWTPGSKASTSSNARGTARASLRAPLKTGRWSVVARIGGPGCDPVTTKTTIRVRARS